MKKILLIISLFPLSAFAASTSSIELPASFNSDIWAQASSLFGSFSPYITMIIGVVLAAIVLEILIGALHKH